MFQEPKDPSCCLPCAAIRSNLFDLHCPGRCGSQLSLSASFNLNTRTSLSSPPRSPGAPGTLLCKAQGRALLTRLEYVVTSPAASYKEVLGPDDELESPLQGRLSRRKKKNKKKIYIFQLFLEGLVCCPTLFFFFGGGSLVFHHARTWMASQACMYTNNICRGKD